jgi:hypothetical protein
MPRIHPVRIETAEPKTAELLKGVKQKLGMVPNLISTMAQSPATTNAYLGFRQERGELIEGSEGKAGERFLEPSPGVEAELVGGE